MSIVMDPRAPSVIRLKIRGEVDMSRFEELDRMLASVGARAPATLEVDLGSVSFMDSQGLKLLLRARQRAAGNGHRLLIVDPGPFIQHLLEVSGLNGTFEFVYGSATSQQCPCCSRTLSTTEPSGDALRLGDGWCPECRWIVLAEVLAGEDHPARCPTHG